MNLGLHPILADREELQKAVQKEGFCSPKSVRVGGDKKEVFSEQWFVSGEVTFLLGRQGCIKQNSRLVKGHIPGRG